MDSVTCPFCNSKQKEPFKKWKYGQSQTIDVSRYKCKCGKTFNHYKNQNRSWTIPKRKN